MEPPSRGGTVGTLIGLRLQQDAGQHRRTRATTVQKTLSDAWKGNDRMAWNSELLCVILAWTWTLWASIIAAGDLVNQRPSEVHVAS